MAPPGRGTGDWQRALREAAPFLGLGTSLALTILVPLAGGYWLDGRLGTAPLFLLAGAVLGMVAAAYHFLKLLSVKKG
jgi:F0F1-type ATP synthase assembly protein I